MRSVVGFVLTLFAASALASSRICTSADTLLFGQQQVGTTATQTAVVSNCGDAPFSFTDVSVHPATAPAFHIDTTCATGQMLAPNDSCSVSVQFAPLAPGQVSGGLWLHNTTATPDQIVTFYGRGIDAQAGTAALAFSPPIVDFGSVALGAQAGPIDLLLTNTGGASLVPSALVINGATPYDFAAELLGDADECTVGSAIAPGATCRLHLYFVPQQAGVRSANIVVDAPQLATLAITTISGYALAAAGAPDVDVTEFHHPPDGQYFLTADPAEAAFLDAGGLGPEWQRTGMHFAAWSRDDVSIPNTLPVCRFFGTPGFGPNSHFYTANPDECALVENNPHWIYEGIAFRARLRRDSQAVAAGCRRHGVAASLRFGPGARRADGHRRLGVRRTGVLRAALGLLPFASWSRSRTSSSSRSARARCSTSRRRTRSSGPRTTSRTCGCSSSGSSGRRSPASRSAW
jgi:hypothetical protein